MIRRLLMIAIRFYQAGPGRLLPRVCRFEPSCSTYALQALQKHGLVRGLGLTAARILRCHPWHPGGYDPVPQRSRTD